MRPVHIAEILASTEEEPLNEAGHAAGEEPRMSGGTFVGMPSFPKAAHEAVHNQTLRGNLRHATHTIRAKRAKRSRRSPTGPQLREAGKQIKDHTLRHLDRYLVQLEESVTAAGGTCTGPPTRTRPTGSSPTRQGDRRDEVVKVKSMATQEIGSTRRSRPRASRLRDRPRRAHRAARQRPPSHILVPAIHRNRGEIREIFRREMASGAARPRRT
jgi:L-lactate dehydrogenase complex protein LldF